MLFVSAGLPRVCAANGITKTNLWWDAVIAQCEQYRAYLAHIYKIKEERLLEKKQVNDFIKVPDAKLTSAEEVRARKEFCRQVTQDHPGSRCYPRTLSGVLSISTIERVSFEQDFFATEIIDIEEDLKYVFRPFKNTTASLGDFEVWRGSDMIAISFKEKKPEFFRVSLRDVLPLVREIAKVKRPDDYFTPPIEKILNSIHQIYYDDEALHLFASKILLDKKFREEVFTRERLNLLIE